MMKEIDKKDKTKWDNEITEIVTANLPLTIICFDFKLPWLEGGRTYSAPGDCSKVLGTWWEHRLNNRFQYEKGTVNITLSFILWNLNRPLAVAELNSNLTCKWKSVAFITLYYKYFIQTAIIKKMLQMVHSNNFWYKTFWLLLWNPKYMNTLIKNDTK